MTPKVQDRMTIANTETRLVPIDSLKPHPDNPRVGNVESIVESIKKNGFYGSVIVRDGTNVILAGTHRWKAAQAAGMAEIPVTFVKTDAKGAKRILLADNRTSDLGDYDDNALREILASLEKSDNLDGTGWTVFDLDDLNASLEAATAPTRGKFDGLEGGAINGQNVGIGPTFAERLDKYKEMTIRTVILNYEVDRYERIAEAMKRARAALDCETSSDLFEVLLAPYASGDPVED